MADPAVATIQESTTNPRRTFDEAKLYELAEERKQQHEQERKEDEAEQERRAEAFRVQREREEQESEAEQARQAEQRKVRTVTFERILEDAPSTFTASQLRVVLRALINLDPYTFADDLAEDLAGDNENEQRSAEEVLLSTIEATADDKLIRFAMRLALAGHVGLPREGKLGLLTEAESVSAPHPQEKGRRNESQAADTDRVSCGSHLQGQSGKTNVHQEEDCSLDQEREPIIGSRFAFSRRIAAREKPLRFLPISHPACSTRARLTASCLTCWAVRASAQCGV